MNVEEKALELIALAYDAALAPQKWSALMAGLVQTMGTRSAILRENCADGSVGLFETVGYDPACVTAYRDHFVHIDHFAPLLRSMPVGSPLRGSEAVPWERQRKTEFYNDYMRPMRNGYVMGAVLARDARYDLLFALQREIGQPDFSDEDMRLICLVAPHMARAAAVHRRLAEATAEKRWAFAALDRLRVGVVLLDERGRPLFANREAERLAGGLNGLSIGRDALSLAASADTARLRRLVADAAALATGRGALATGRGAPGGDCLHTSAGGGAPLQLHVIPLPRGLSEGPLEARLPCGCVAVFVCAGGGARLSPEHIAAMHGLTPAEARLAALLAGGDSPDEAAAALAVSVGTVRSQLKSIFAKTGVARQAELVALLLADMLAHEADGIPSFGEPA